ncbi:MAG TPA: zf-TFIIB domain-containing protein [Polyangiaceae bacterium]|nr:zf-TFIIB domain-containing protein [Polyangiaceae bacterium]
MTDRSTEPRSWSCPGCRGALEQAEVPDGVITGCATCGGMWIDNRASQAAVRAALSPAARAFIHQIGSSARTAPKEEAPYRDAPAPSARVCPVCDGSLATRKLPDPPVVVDVCLEHGTYFDRWELSQIAQRADERAWAAHHAAHAAAYEAAWRAQYGSGDRGFDEVAMGVADVLRRL